MISLCFSYYCKFICLCKNTLISLTKALAQVDEQALNIHIRPKICQCNFSF